MTEKSIIEAQEQLQQDIQVLILAFHQRYRYVSNIVVHVDIYENKYEGGEKSFFVGEVKVNIGI